MFRPFICYSGVSPEGSSSPNFCLASAFLSWRARKMDITPSITSWNLAMIFGVGYRISLGKTRLVLEGRYTQGLVNLSEETIQKDLIPRVKTNGFNILMGFEIPISKSK